MNRSQENVIALIQELKQFLKEHAQKKAAFSAWSVLQHIEHSAKVGIFMVRALLSEKNQAPPEKSFKRAAFLKMGRIPRGVVEAPKIVRPSDSPTTEGVYAQLEAMEKAVYDAEHAPAQHSSPHPMFGRMNADETVAFIGIHTAHHLAIIKDIIAKS